MAWSNSAIWVVGDIVTHTDINNRIFEQLKYLKGTQASQAIISLDSELSTTTITGTGGGQTFDLNKQYLAAGGVAIFHLHADNADVPSSIEDGYGARLLAEVSESGGAEEFLAEFRWSREAEGDGELKIHVYDAGVLSTDPLLHINSGGEVGFIGEAETGVALKVHGTLNATAYRVGGAVANDWTLAGAGQLEWTGDAKVDQRFRSTVPTGTAPLTVDSTTEVANLSASLLDSYAWHPGLTNTTLSYTELGSSDTDLADASVVLDRIGTWLCLAVVDTLPDGVTAPETMSYKIKDGAGTQIGATAEYKQQSIETFFQQSVLIAGFYTSAAGNETIKVTGATSDVSSTTNASAKLVCVWRGP